MPKATATEPAPAPPSAMLREPALWGQGGEWTAQGSAPSLEDLHTAIAKFYGGSKKELLPVMPDVWAVATPGGQVLEQMRVRLAGWLGRPRYVFESLTPPAAAPAVPTVPAPAAWAQAGEWTTQASAGTLDALHSSIAKFYGGSQKQLLPVMPNVWAVATPGGQVLEQMRVRLSPARGRSRFVFESLTPPAAAPAVRAVQAPSGPPAGVDARQGALFSAFQSSLAAALPSILGTP